MRGMQDKRLRGNNIRKCEGKERARPGREVRELVRGRKKSPVKVCLVLRLLLGEVDKKKGGKD